MPIWRHRVTPDEAGGRLDRLLEESLQDVSRSQIKRWADQNLVLVNGAPAKAGHGLRPGEAIEVDVPEPLPITLVPESIDIHVVHEDEHLVVVDKPAGLAVHPGAGRDRGTLVNALLGRGIQLSPLGAPSRPGVVHRLDMGTSGLLMVAKTETAHRELARQLADREVIRRYWALVWGRPEPPQCRIEGALARSRADRRRMRVVGRGGKPAVTRYRRVWTDGVLSVLWLALETGRTHQIRVHIRHRGHPVFADPEYDGRLSRSNRVPHAARERVQVGLGVLNRQALHAAVLVFAHPAGGERMRFTSALPQDIVEAALLAGVERKALEIPDVHREFRRDAGETGWMEDV